MANNQHYWVVFGKFLKRKDVLLLSLLSMEVLLFFSHFNFDVAFQECVSSLEHKIDETEKKCEEMSKLNQVSVSNNDLINKLAAENEQLKVIFLVSPCMTIHHPLTLLLFCTY